MIHPDLPPVCLGYRQQLSLHCTPQSTVYTAVHSVLHSALGTMQCTVYCTVPCVHCSAQCTAQCTPLCYVHIVHIRKHLSACGLGCCNMRDLGLDQFLVEPESTAGSVCSSSFEARVISDMLVSGVFSTGPCSPASTVLRPDDLMLKFAGGPETLLDRRKYKYGKKKVVFFASKAAFYI